MSVWALQGTATQKALVEQALAACDFPFDRLLASLQREGKQQITVEWADLSRSARGAGEQEGGHEQEHAEGVHSVGREVDGRARVLGLFYLPPHTRIVLDVSLEQNPQLAMEVFLAEAAHAVDYHYMVDKGLRLPVWNAIHGSALTVPVPESGDFDHGHSWFDGAGGYGTWVGESMMAAFVKAFAPSVPVTINLAHPITVDVVVQVRTALLGQPDPPPPPSALPPSAGRVYRGAYRSVYHDAHRRIAPAEWYQSAVEAEAAGLRPCRSCKPAGGRAFNPDYGEDELDGCSASADGARGSGDLDPDGGFGDLDPDLVCLFPGDLVGPVDWLAEQWTALFADGPNPEPVPGLYDVCKVIDSEGEVAPSVAEIVEARGAIAYGYDLGLFDRLRAEGLNAVEVAGCRTRGSSTYRPAPHLSHHTGGAGSALSVIINGRSDLPGPLSQTNTHRNQTVYVVACGRANHAGPGGWMGHTGNTACSGDEADNVGTAAEPWSAQARLTRSKVAAAQLKGRGLDARYHCRHAEWASPPGRKPDVHSTDGNRMRAETAAVLGGPPPPPPGPRTLREGDSGPDVADWQRTLVRAGESVTDDGRFGPLTRDATARLQRRLGLPDDGVVGPQTRAATADLLAPPPATPKETEMFIPRPGREVLIISSAVDGWALDLPDAGGRDGDPVQTYPQDGGPDQRWEVRRHGEECNLVSTGKTLDGKDLGDKALDAWYVTPALPIEGQPVRVFTPHDGPQQRWQIVPVPGCSENHIVHRESGLVLTVEPGRPNGLVMLAVKNEVTPNQRFRLIASV